MTYRIGLILLGTSILYIMVYVVNLFVLYMRAKRVRTSSKGIKRLKFQTANNTWKKFMRHYEKYSRGEKKVI